MGVGIVGHPAFLSLLYIWASQCPSLRTFPFQDIKANFGNLQLDSNRVEPLSSCGIHTKSLIVSEPHQHRGGHIHLETE